MPDKSLKKPFVHLIGAGPGDPGLITVKGRESLGRADVVIYDYLANDDLLRFARPDAELIYAGKIGGHHNREQWQINALLVEKALAGNVVARLKGGDSFVFGRGGEECEALVAAGIPFEIVPGVTAGIGVTAYAGIPLTHRGVTTSVTFVTGHEGHDKEVSQIDWEGLSLGSGTVVFYMGIKNLPQITANLMAHGRPPETPVALIRWGTRPEQEVLTGTLADIAEQARRTGFRAPAITVVGEVVRLREKLRWFDNRPLFGTSILVTRAADQAGEFGAMLGALGARVLECPTIAIVPPESWDNLDAAIASLDRFHWAVFTSVNAVRFFFERLAAAGKDSRALGNCRVCAVGPKTAAALAPFGIRPDLIPADYKGEGVVEVFRSEEIAGKRIIFPKGDRARDVIPQGLAELGGEVTAPVAYRNVTPDSLPAGVIAELEERRITCVTFTSSSTVENLAAILGENRFLHLLKGVTIAAIGPITARTCRELGLEVHVEPSKYTLAAMTDALVDFFSRSK
ncbi:uroporphyrinogen III C2,C7-methyltransferase and uroporphyrinogen III synthase [Geobacter metallireducens GS-15]|uniref:uroporphyrinogen-III C-methyltransferase n=1 Tax=Geobacter metallireducens (strain ATCC 53774 / DSM 7210 / GS-15) TaxID=269799 RepID=Q39QM6_GEOMG|nr:uroporphyrinogen-III C-methyltransferase [Geobacter metallireducens]ABB33448.1 uroporphyrinogen III C2,C7-methyltransferase and uroporphyrinogen III synthase [Geobacter metallireducens GS-15]